MFEGHLHEVEIKEGLIYLDGIHPKGVQGFEIKCAYEPGEAMVKLVLTLQVDLKKSINSGSSNMDGDLEKRVD